MITKQPSYSIKNGIQKFGVSNVTYPHFIGTIDSFINNYIFFHTVIYLWGAIRDQRSSVPNKTLGLITMRR